MPPVLSTWYADPLGWAFPNRLTRSWRIKLKIRHPSTYLSANELSLAALVCSTVPRKFLELLLLKVQAAFTACKDSLIL